MEKALSQARATRGRTQRMTVCSRHSLQISASAVVLWSGFIPDDSPAGFALELDPPQLFAFPKRHFACLADIEAEITEQLVVPVAPLLFLRSFAWLAEMRATPVEPRIRQRFGRCGDISSSRSRQMNCGGPARLQRRLFRRRWRLSLSPSGRSQNPCLSENLPEIPLMFASPAFCQDDFRLFSQKPQVRFLVADSRSMNTLKPDATQVIDAAMAAVEILRSVCGIDLKEAQIDALLCSCYREYISSGALSSETA
ncbi:hypothetical protein [Paraburkholderia youngii]|uniref:hypothetical protein n=2 Tax=Paraburkholderia youngii TaxID=2782701 RepID=UPI003D24665F